MEFEAEFARLHAELRLPGLAVGLIRGRELWWFKGYGFANLAEKTLVTRDTPFHLASLTKTYASTLLMQLVGHGRLDLDTPAADFGIDLKSRGTVTVRHLFSQTSRGKPGDRSASGRATGDAPQVTAAPTTDRASSWLSGGAVVMVALDLTVARIAAGSDEDKYA